MKKKEHLNLIEGTFSSQDAKEILFQLFKNKINYYNIKNWSSNERTGKGDDVSQKRLSILRNELNTLQEIIEHAKANNKSLKVYSEIKIELV